MTQKYFFRIDGQNHPIPGTLVKLKEKPTNGRWKQVLNDGCCFPCTLEERTFISPDPIAIIGSPVDIVITLNSVVIYVATDLVAAAINSVNNTLLGIAVVTLNEDDTLTMVSSVCVDMEITTENVI